MKILAIVGTAGRKDDEAKLAAIPNAFAQMCQTAKKFLETKFPNEKVHLISGGAAWADHIAVQLFNEGAATQLTLETPCEFTETPVFQYHDNGNFGNTNPGGTANYYHKKFARALNLKSAGTLAQIQTAKAKGAIINTGKGFIQRNTSIATKADILLAFTFGNKHIVKNGGTANTVETFVKTKHSHSNAFHCDLHTFKVWTSATTPKIEETPSTTK